MTREDIVKRFYQLNAFLDTRKIYFEFNVYGGAAMALYYDFRRSTEDIDCVIRSSDDNIKECLAEFNREHGLPHGWINQAVKVFVPENTEADTVFELSNLRVSVCSPQVLLAMKCRAGRITDINDIRELLRTLGIKTIEEVILNHQRFFPNKELSEEILFIIKPMLPYN